MQQIESITPCLIVPAAMGALMTGPDPQGSERVMTAIAAMKKIDMAALEPAVASVS